MMQDVITKKIYLDLNTRNIPEKIQKEKYCFRRI